MHVNTVQLECGLIRKRILRIYYPFNYGEDFLSLEMDRRTYIMDPSPYTNILLT